VYIESRECGYTASRDRRYNEVVCSVVNSNLWPEAMLEFVTILYINIFKTKFLVNICILSRTIIQIEIT
jgi:hypothetical protein